MSSIRASAPSERSAGWAGRGTGGLDPHDPPSAPPRLPARIRPPDPSKYRSRPLRPTPPSGRWIQVKLGSWAVDGDPWQIRCDRPLTEAYWAWMELRGHYGGWTTPALRWWMRGADDGVLNPAERAIFNHVAGCNRVLDVGAGDLRVRNRLRRAGFSGVYETLDASTDIFHDFESLDEVPSGSYDGVMALEVIEHITLDDFHGFIDGILRVLRPGGKVVISTPNARFYETIWAGALDHRHPYLLGDLAAYLRLRGVEADQLYRVEWRSPSDGLKTRLRRHLIYLFAKTVLPIDTARGVLYLGHLL